MDKFVDFKINHVGNQAPVMDGDLNVMERGVIAEWINDGVLANAPHRPGAITNLVGVSSRLKSLVGEG